MMHHPHIIARSVQSCRKALRHALLPLILASLLLPLPADAQVMGAAQRAAARKAGDVAARQVAMRAEAAAVRASAQQGCDVALRQWRTRLCSSRAPCPLPPEVGNRFQGGSYREVVLGRDTLLHGRMTAQEEREGRPLTKYTMVSRHQPPSPPAGRA